MAAQRGDKGNRAPLARPRADLRGELLGMSLWFSASAVVPALRVEWGLSDSIAGWLTIAVQLGFVAGTLLSAFLNLRT